MIFPWSRLPLCKRCFAQRVARDADRCPNCGGTRPGQYLFPVDHLRLYIRNPWAAMEPMIGWIALVLVLLLVLSAIGKR